MGVTLEEILAMKREQQRREYGRCSGGEGGEEVEVTDNYR